MIKGEDSFFYQTIYGSNHDIIIRTRDLSQSIPLPPTLRESERSLLSLNLFIWNLGSSIFYLFFLYILYIFFFLYLLLFFLFCFILYLFHFDFLPLSFYSPPSFLKSHRFVDPVESDPFSHRAKGTKEIRLIFRSKYVKSSVFSPSSVPIP